MNSLLNYPYKYTVSLNLLHLCSINIGFRSFNDNYKN